MEIITAFNLGNTAFYINKGSVKSAAIAEIRIRTFKARTGIKTTVSYILDKDSSLVFPGENLFLTEEEANAVLNKGSEAVVSDAKVNTDNNLS